MIDNDYLLRLVEAAEDANVHHRTDYSGRGMYGAECFAIYGNTVDLIRFLRNLDDATADQLSDPAIDNMGLDYVYYWSTLRTKEASF